MPSTVWPCGALPEGRGDGGEGRGGRGEGKGRGERRLQSLTRKPSLIIPTSVVARYSKAASVKASSARRPHAEAGLLPFAFPTLLYSLWISLFHAASSILRTIPEFNNDLFVKEMPRRSRRVLQRAEASPKAAANRRHQTTDQTMTTSDAEPSATGVERGLESSESDYTLASAS